MQYVPNDDFMIYLGSQDMCYTLEFEKYSVTTWFGLLNARDVLAVPL